MSKNNEKNTQVTKRDRLILRHIADFTMTTFDALHVLFYETQKKDAVKSTLR